MPIASNNLVIQQEIRQMVQDLVTQLSNLGGSGYSQPWHTGYTANWIANALSTANLDTQANYRNIPNTVSFASGTITASLLINFIRTVFLYASRRRMTRLIQYYNNRNTYQVEADVRNYMLWNTNSVNINATTPTINANTIITASQLVTTINSIKSAFDTVVNNNILTYSWVRCHSSCHSSCNTRGRR